jgi:hypothetical protein
MKVNTDTSTKLDIEAKQDDTFNLVMNVKDSDGGLFDFSGYVATMEIKTPDSRTALGLTSMASAEDLNEAFIPSTITLSEGKIILLVSSSDMSISKSSYKYYLKLSNYNSSNTWFVGRFRITSN